jgi:hypothetical protein
MEVSDELRALAALPPREEPSLLIGGWLDLRSGRDPVENRNILLSLLGIEFISHPAYGFIGDIQITKFLLIYR